MGRRRTRVFSAVVRRPTGKAGSPSNRRGGERSSRRNDVRPPSPLPSCSLDQSFWCRERATAAPSTSWSARSSTCRRSGTPQLLSGSKTRTTSRRNPISRRRPSRGSASSSETPYLQRKNGSGGNRTAQDFNRHLAVGEGTLACASVRECPPKHHWLHLRDADEGSGGVSASN